MDVKKRLAEVETAMSKLQVLPSVKNYQTLSALKSRLSSSVEEAGGRSQKWFDSLKPQQKKVYLSQHPNSKFGTSGKATPKRKPKVKRTRLKPVPRSPKGSDAAAITGIGKATGNVWSDGGNVMAKRKTMLAETEKHMGSILSNLGCKQVGRPSTETDLLGGGDVEIFQSFKLDKEPDDAKLAAVLNQLEDDQGIVSSYDKKTKTITLELPAPATRKEMNDD